MGREPGDLARFLFRDAAGRAFADHPDDESFSALLETATPEQGDPEIVEHLASCDRCRREWIRMRQDARELEGGANLADAPWETERSACDLAPGATGREARRSWIVPGYRLLLSTAGALVLAGAALLIPWGRLSTQDPLRSQARQESVRPLGPVGEVRAGELPAFRWTAAPGATAYEIVVVELSTGRTVLRVRTTEALHVLSDGDAALLEPGRGYRWLVRAERGTGRTQTGQPAAFLVLPAR